jgi:hypothetical protein
MLRIIYFVDLGQGDFDVKVPFCPQVDVGRRNQASTNTLP